MATAVAAVLLLTAAAGSHDPDPPAAATDPEAGLLTLPDGRRLRAALEDLTYTGEGTYTFADGEVYTGTFVNGQPQGHGHSVSPEGVIYDGQWADGVEHGHGRLTLPDGGVYEGDFLDGNQTGQGVFTSAAGRYSGLWKNGVPEGHGIFEYPDGSVYTGQWHGGRRHGPGRWRAADGSLYEGDWAGNRPHGMGELHEASGGVYRGEWQHGTRTGYGVWVGLAGDRYEGMWLANRRHGYGYERTLEQHEYSGYWQADVRYGSGRLDIPDVSSHTGGFADGQPAGAGTRQWQDGGSGTGNWHDDLLLSGRLDLPGGQHFDGQMLVLTDAGPRTTAAFLDWLADGAAHDPVAAWLHGIALTEWRARADRPAALRSLRAAAEAGHLRATTRLGRALIRSDTAAALAWLQRAATAGDVLATVRLAQLYQDGRHVERDPRAAIELYGRVVERSTIARNNLAWLLATSDDASLLDPERAIALARPLVAARPNHGGFLDTLAAALARAGRYAEAERLQRRAVQQLADHSAAGELAELEQRLALYAAGEPFTSPAAGSAEPGAHR